MRQFDLTSEGSLSGSFEPFSPLNPIPFRPPTPSYHRTASDVSYSNPYRNREHSNALADSLLSSASDLSSNNNTSTTSSTTSSTPSPLLHGLKSSVGGYNWGSSSGLNRGLNRGLKRDQNKGAVEGLRGIDIQNEESNQGLKKGEGQGQRKVTGEMTASAARSNMRYRQVDDDDEDEYKKDEVDEIRRALGSKKDANTDKDTDRKISEEEHMQRDRTKEQWYVEEEEEEEEDDIMKNIRELRNKSLRPHTATIDVPNKTSQNIPDKISHVEESEVSRDKANASRDSDKRRDRERERMREKARGRVNEGTVSNPVLPSIRFQLTSRVLDSAATRAVMVADYDSSIEFDAPTHTDMGQVKGSERGSARGSGGRYVEQVGDDSDGDGGLLEAGRLREGEVRGREGHDVTRTRGRGGDTKGEGVKDLKEPAVKGKAWRVKDGTAVVARAGGRDRREREEEYRIDGRLRAFQSCMENESNLTIFSSSTSFSASSSSSSSLGSRASHSTASSSSSRRGEKEESAMVSQT